jgi:two-component system chemotaxis response regulator CheB
VNGGASPRVLICEDSRTYGAALKRFLEYDGDIDVVGVCTSAEETIRQLPRLQPNLVTLDVELRGMNGLEATEHIMGKSPVPILVLSGHVGPQNDVGAAALAAGALEVLEKAGIDLKRPTSPEAVKLRRRVKVLSRAHVIRHIRARDGGRASDRYGREASVIGICASTGGPQLLALLLEGLPEDFPIPLLVVQHMAAGFTEGLAHWLDRTARLPVRLAQAGVMADRGAWIAPEGAHLRLEPSGLLTLDRRTVAGAHRPSGDVLLESIARAAGRSGVAVVLTGMGRDGAMGAAAVKLQGGLTIAQDEESSAVYGMPKAAVERGVELVLPPAQIVARLRTLRHQQLGATS